MGFPKDVSKRAWTWDVVEGDPHVRLTQGRMLRIRPRPNAANEFVLELITKTSVVELEFETNPEWLQAYGEYIFAGQNYVDER